jgi:hypothetical protein
MATPPPRHGRLSIDEISDPATPGTLSLDGGDDLWSVAERLVDTLAHDLSLGEEQPAHEDGGHAGRSAGERQTDLSPIRFDGAASTGTGAVSMKAGTSVLESSLLQLREMAEEADDVSMSRLVRVPRPCSPAPRPPP